MREACSDDEGTGEEAFEASLTWISFLGFGSLAFCAKRTGKGQHEPMISCAHAHANRGRNLLELTKGYLAFRAAHLANIIKMI